jgi:dolichol kinase
MALADPAAAIVGKNYPFGSYQFRKQKKTISGSLTFFIVAVLICLPFISLNFWWLILMIALSTTIVEGLSKNGFDNFSIPLTVAINLIVLS